MTCYDLDNLDVVIVKDWQSLLDVLNDLLTCCQAIDANTDEIEAKLDAQIALLTSIDDELIIQSADLDDIRIAVEAIQATTDQMNFTAGKLRTTGEDGGGGGGSGCCQGNTSSVFTRFFASPPSDAQLVASNTARKELIVYNGTNKTVWLMYGAGPAVVGQGIPIGRGDIFFNDKFTGEIRYITTNGVNGNLQITEVTT